MRRTFGRIARLVFAIFGAMVVCAPIVRTELLDPRFYRIAAVSGPVGSAEAGFSMTRFGAPASGLATAPNASAGSLPGGVQLGVPTVVLGWAELYNGCFLNEGSWTVTVPPSHGAISFEVFSGGTDACGNPVPYNGLYYTWTDADASFGATDTFSATWQSDDGRFTQPGTWTFARASPDKQIAQCDCSCPCGGNPIVISTGAKAEAVTDYQTAGPNQLSFQRYYNFVPTFATGAALQPTTLATELGRNWRSNFDRYLRKVSSGSRLVAVVAERKDGRLLSFGRSGSGWASDSDVDVKLTESGSTFTVIDSDDTVEAYVSIGSTEALLSSIRARDGYTQTLRYNSGHQLVSVTDSYGRSLSFTYVSGLLSAVKTPDGLVLSYGYDKQNRLTSVVYSTNPKTSQTYVYENSAFPTALTGIIDEDGNRFATWAYDGLGRVVSSEHAGGADLTTIAFDDTTGSRTVTDPLGQQTVYQFTNLQGAPKVIEIDRVATATTAAAKQTIAYDANGYVKSRTDWNGNLTTYVNDPRGLPTTVTEAVGTPQQRQTRIAWLANLHLPSRIDAPELTTKFVYDDSGDLLTRGETDTTRTTIPYSTRGETRTWHYSWAKFLPISATDPRGATTRLRWDAGGALAAITNALGQETRITQHLPGGLPKTVVDPNGVVTRLAYDVRDRLLSNTVETAAGPLRTSFGYDAVGNLTTLALPDGATLANAYDAAHRLVAIADLLNNQIDYTLDALGDRTATQLTAGGTLKAEHSARFDALGRLIEDIGGAGQTTSYAYDAEGNPVKVTDPLSRVTSQTFDPLDRLVQRIDPAAGKTLISYSPQDEPAKITDPNGNPTDYVYDGFGDVIEEASPDAGKTTYHYDLAGNRVQRVDAAGAITNYRYDALDRLTARRYPADASADVSYVYDQPGAGFGIGRLTKVIDEGGTLMRRYDERGNVLRDVRMLGPAILTTAYAYDAANRIAAVTYPSGWVARYTRDAMGRITAVAAKPPGGAALPVAGSIAYQPFGPLDGLVYGNGKAETRTYDLDYRLTALTEAGTAASRAATYAYDAVDNVLSVADSVFGTQRFGYDKLNRLSRASGFYGDQQFGYDPVGNRLRVTSGSATTRFVYAPHSNRLTAVESGGTALRAFRYSPTGNIVSDRSSLTQIVLGYDQDHRLASVENRSKSGGVVDVDYLYDGFGQRIEKKLLGSGGIDTAYQYDLGGHLLEERDLAGGTSRTNYIYLDDRPIATITPGGTVAFYETGLLGTPQRVSGASQSALWSANYQPFGQTKLLVANIVQNLRFPGQYADAETGYYHNGFRDYDPSLGRYLESDPIGLNGGLSTYVYAGGNPVRFIDPDGLDYVPPNYLPPLPGRYDPAGPLPWTFPKRSYRTRKSQVPRRGTGKTCATRPNHHRIA
jgi:RHS repeat-associated protein